LLKLVSLLFGAAASTRRYVDESASCLDKIASFEWQSQIGHVLHAKVDKLLQLFLANISDDALLKNELAFLVRNQTVLREYVVIFGQGFFWFFKLKLYRH
jgi:hypothetical protein